MPFGKRKGGVENPKVVRLRSVALYHKARRCFSVYERPGPYGPPDVALPVMGMPQKRYRRNNTKRVISPFSGDVLCFIPKAAIRGVGRSPGKE